MKNVLYLILARLDTCMRTFYIFAFSEELALVTRNNLVLWFRVS